MKQWFTYRDLAERGLGNRVTVWRKVRNGKFPPPRQIDSGVSKFWAPDIEEWEQSRPIVSWAAQNEASGS